MSDGFPAQGEKSMAAANKHFEKIKSFFISILDGIKSGWKAFRRGLKNFINAPFSWTWNSIKYLYRQLARFIRWLLMQPVRFFRAIIKWFANLTGRRVWAFTWRLAVWVVVILAVGLFAAVQWPHSQVPKVEAPDQVVYLDQGWGAGREAVDRQTYYFTPQGTGNVLKNMRYDWFVNLELPWGQRRFADPLHMLSYGFEVDAEPTPGNPDLLPVGFARHYDPRLGDDVLDITCATCHTGNLLVTKEDGSSVSLRIDGGQGMHAFTAANMPHFVPVLIASMTSTLVNPIKFNRFANKVLGPFRYEDGKAALREEFKKTFWALLDMGITEKRHDLVSLQEGYARTDALTRIGNAVFGDHITPDNYKKVDAPVNYPPVWDIWKFDWVQYSGSVAQPMARNLGESLGVGTSYNFFSSDGKPIPEEYRYDTSTRLEDLHKIEVALRALRPPVWPQDLLGDIDQDKAVKGGIAFIRTCHGCHGPHPAGERQRTVEAPLKKPEQPHWRMKLLSTNDIGTDPVAAVNFVRRTFDLSSTGLGIQEVREVVGDELDQCYDRMLGYDFSDKNRYKFCDTVDRSVPDNECIDKDTHRKHYESEKIKALDAINLSATTNGQGLNYFGLLMKRKLYADAKYTDAKIQDLNGFGALDIPQVKMDYKARPLAGVWATAPYLHNGSVPNLYQMLSPQHERDQRFFIGRPEFDPEHVGIKFADKKHGGFWMDTTITGNANTGHEFRDGYTEWAKDNAPQFGVIGPAYTRDERLEIIEYLKVHLDDPPHSGLFLETFTGIVSSIKASIQDQIASGNNSSWSGGEACNLREYLDNHSKYATGLSEELKADIIFIQNQLGLDAYACAKEPYDLCGVTTPAPKGRR